MPLSKRQKAAKRSWETRRANAAKLEKKAKPMISAWMAEVNGVEYPDGGDFATQKYKDPFPGTVTDTVAVGTIKAFTTFTVNVYNENDMLLTIYENVRAQTMAEAITIVKNNLTFVATRPII
jgi:hypothetical protein